jgi:hypothetical protein
MFTQHEVEVFNEAVNILLKAGWELHGTQVVGSGNFVTQAFIKKEKADGN